MRWRTWFVDNILTLQFYNIAKPTQSMILQTDSPNCSPKNNRSEQAISPMNRLIQLSTHLNQNFFGDWQSSLSLMGMRIFEATKKNRYSLMGMCDDSIRIRYSWAMAALSISTFAYDPLCIITKDRHATSGLWSPPNSATSFSRQKLRQIS
jgi:hypothetical protein